MERCAREETLREKKENTRPCPVRSRNSTPKAIRMQRIPYVSLVHLVAMDAMRFGGTPHGTRHGEADRDGRSRVRSNDGLHRSIACRGAGHGRTRSLLPQRSLDAETMRNIRQGPTGPVPRDLSGCHHSDVRIRTFDRRTACPPSFRFSWHLVRSIPPSIRSSASDRALFSHRSVSPTTLEDGPSRSMPLFLVGSRGSRTRRNPLVCPSGPGSCHRDLPSPPLAFLVGSCTFSIGMDPRLRACLVRKRNARRTWTRSRALLGCPRTSEVAMDPVAGARSLAGPCHPVEAATRRSARRGTTPSFERRSVCSVRRNIRACSGKTPLRRRLLRPSNASRPLGNVPTDGGRRRSDEATCTWIGRPIPRDTGTKPGRQSTCRRRWIQTKWRRWIVRSPNRRRKGRELDASDRCDPKKTPVAAINRKDTGRRSCLAKGPPWRPTCRQESAFRGVEKWACLPTRSNASKTWDTS